VELEKTAENR